MAQFFDEIPERLFGFIERQPVFFVASATGEGRINLSPKGMDCFRILDSKCCGYLDLTGSGAETTAHIVHDGRLTFMFNSFDREPLILRLYGRGRTAPVGSPLYEELSPKFPSIVGARQLIFIDIESVQTSCGYAVPEMALKAVRQTLVKSAERKGDDGLKKYWEEKNAVSIDGLSTGLGDGAE